MAVRGTMGSAAPLSAPPRLRPTSPNSERRLDEAGREYTPLHEPRAGDAPLRDVDSPAEARRHPKGRSELDERLEPRNHPEADSSEALSQLSAGSLADRLVFLLARNRRFAPREAVLDQVTQLVVAIDRPELVQRALLTMGGPIVDIYPLELLARVAKAAPELVPKVSFEPFVKNRAILEAARFFVEDPIRFDLPIALKLRAFALDGGGYPGYCLSPGAPGEYVLEMAGSGLYPVLLRGDLHKKAVIDRIVLQIAEGPPTSD
ncbi:MAG: hypothetical protein HY791_27710 [Deltaproteobacteria bacterium]|nr:hypothetical protein [Deltaproteobacteria bacterium]